MEFKVIFEDENVLVIDKPAGIVVFPEGQTKEGTVIDHLIEKYPELKQAGEAPRYGVVHRLDKDTSGILLVAKTAEALIFFQKQFKNREVSKKYTALVTGQLKTDNDEIKTLMARAPGDKRKQKAYPIVDQAPKSAREAITQFRILEKFKDYTLLEVQILTGRRHQIRCHFSYVHHPIAGDKLYGFKDSPCPKDLKRQFLHASYLKIQLPSGEIKEFKSELPEELKKVLESLEKHE